MVFLKELSNDEMDLEWLTVPFGQLTFDSEGNDLEYSLYFSRHPHVPNNKGTVIGSSGVTFGRGLDLGQQTTTYLERLLQEMEKHSQPLSASLKSQLPGGVETRY